MEGHTSLGRLWFWSRENHRTDQHFLSKTVFGMKMHWFITWLFLKVGSTWVWLVVQTQAICTREVPNVFLCIPLSVLVTSLSLQVFLNSSLYSSLTYQILANPVKGMHLLLFFFSVLKMEHGWDGVVVSGGCTLTSNLSQTRGSPKCLRGYVQEILCQVCTN